MLPRDTEKTQKIRSGGGRTHDLWSMRRPVNVVNCRTQRPQYIKIITLIVFKKNTLTFKHINKSYPELKLMSREVPVLKIK